MVEGALWKRIAIMRKRQRNKRDMEACYDRQQEYHSNFSRHFVYGLQL